MKVDNSERCRQVRQVIERKRLKYLEVADAVGIDPSTLSHWLRKMSQERYDRIMRAIESIEL